MATDTGRGSRKGAVTMKNRVSWRGTLVVVSAIGAGWIGYMGWPLYGLITPAAEQSNSPNRALMCRLVNEYRAKHGLKPVQLDGAVTREAQYWSDQLNRQSACWFLYHDYNYHARMRARFPGRRFRENAACSGSTGGGARFILRKWIDSSGHRENMLTPEWKTIGVGVTRNIWVIDFTNYRLSVLIVKLSALSGTQGTRAHMPVPSIG
jgi:cysteine-rich secretory family protein